MAPTPPNPPPPPLTCQPCAHIKDPSTNQYLRHMTCCGSCKYTVCRSCFVQNFRYRKARDAAGAARLTLRAELEESMEAQGKTYADLSFEELLEWSDDSAWEGEGKEGKGGVKKRKKPGKECAKDCYGECCLGGGWVWLQGKYAGDDGRPDLFDIVREWFDEEEAAAVDARYYKREEAKMMEPKGTRNGNYA